MDYDDLSKVAKEIFIRADQLNILSRLYWYSPKSRKLKPASKIGYYDREPKGIYFEHGCKLIMVFPRLAYNDLEPILNTYLPQNKQIAEREDYKCTDDIGFDVYQRIEELKLFIEPDSMDSMKYTVESMLKKGEYWFKCQQKALEESDPPLTTVEIEQAMKQAIEHFQQAKSYLEAQGLNAELRVRRNSGFRHRMIRILPGDKTNRKCFSDLVLVFGTSSKRLPLVTLPKPPNPKYKRRSDSIAAQYKANPSSFKYYDKFGIFEVLER